jgi:glutamine synthetase
VLVRATIRGVSAQHGLRASFAPAFEPGGVGNGGHLHLSVWREGRNLLAGQPPTPDGEAFLAGVLRELPALLALGAPSPASYLRLVPSHWAGCFHCWGVENREAALRLVQGTDEQANVEVKCFDQAANPYLAVGGVIAAGLAGLDGEAVLPEPVQGDPALLPPERQPARLPTGLDGTLTAFRASTVLRDALGDVLFEAVAAVRAAEKAAYGEQPPDAVIAATRWRY